MFAQMQTPPCFAISDATNPIRRMFRSRCSLEKPNSLERCLLTTSPSSRVTLRPEPLSLSISAFAVVDLPAPDRPVRKTVKPFPFTGRGAPALSFGRPSLHPRRCRNTVPVWRLFAGVELLHSGEVRGREVD